MSSLPLLKPSCTEAEIQAVADVLRSGWWGQGKQCEQFEAQFAARYGLAAECCVTAHSATAALHLALVVSDIRPGDEVITTALTFISDALAVSYLGARPVFADVEAATLCLDWQSVLRKITKHTRAVIAVDYGGYPARPSDDVLAELHDRQIIVIQDAAHAAGGSLWGDLATFSFHPVKNLATGDGGAVLTSSLILARRLRSLRWCGIDRSTWERSQRKYGWDYDIAEIGYKYHWNDIQAAIGLVQLGRLSAMNARRREIAAYYRAQLGQWYQLPPDHDQHTWHLYPIRCEVERRDSLLDRLLGREISAGVHYKPLTYYPMYADQRTPPVTEYEWRRLISLPIYPDMLDTDMLRVVQALKD